MNRKSAKEESGYKDADDLSIGTFSQSEYLRLRRRYRPRPAAGSGPLTGERLAAEERFLLGRDVLDPGKVLPIAKAAIRGDVAAVKDALDAGASPNATLFEGGIGQTGENMSLLGLAISTGQRQIIKVLLEHGASPNPLQLGEAPNGEAFPVGSPLVIAAENGEDDVIELLLQYGASVDQTSSIPGAERTALSAAVALRNVSTAYLLLMRGARIDSALGPGGVVPESIVMAGDHDPYNAAMEKLLLSHGAVMPPRNGVVER